MTFSINDDIVIQKFLVIMSLFEGTNFFFDKGKDWISGITVIKKAMDVVGAKLESAPSFPNGYINLRGLPSQRIEFTIDHRLISAAREAKVFFRGEFLLANGQIRDGYYKFCYYTEECRWQLETSVNLHPIPAYESVSLIREGFFNRFAYSETLRLYNLVKYLHYSLNSELTAASMVCQDVVFGESEGTHMGYDSILRFDRTGRCRLVRPYEENLDITKEDFESRKVDGNIVANWCLDSKEPLDIKIPNDFIESLNIERP